MTCEAGFQATYFDTYRLWDHTEMTGYPHFTYLLHLPSLGNKKDPTCNRKTKTNTNEDFCWCFYFSPYTRRVFILPS
jgi:hypothetical protein